MVPSQAASWSSTALLAPLATRAAAIISGLSWAASGDRTSSCAACIVAMSWPSRETTSSFDALLTERYVPVERDQMRVLGRHDGGVGGADGAGCRIDHPRQLLERHDAFPVVLRIPTRYGCATGDGILWVAHGQAARSDHADVAVGVRHDHALHRHDVGAHVLEVVGHGAQAGIEHAGGNCRVVVVERRPAQSGNVVRREHRRRGYDRSRAAPAHAGCGGAPGCARGRL